MSYFGRWKCRACGKEWTGSIGWTLPPLDKLQDYITAICGCKRLEDPTAAVPTDFVPAGRIISMSVGNVKMPEEATSEPPANDL